MRTRTIYIIICVALLMTACSTDEGTPVVTIPSGDQMVTFSAAMLTDENAQTRVGYSNDIQTKKQLNDMGGFGVFGCYTGLHKYVDSNVSPNFMYNERVTSTDDGATWTYSPLKYWPNGEGEVSGNTGANKHYVSFMAYAPWSNNVESDPAGNPAGYCIPSFSLQGEVGNPWLTYRLIDQTNLSKQVDLLYASHKGVYPGDPADLADPNFHPILDWTKPDVSRKVKFVFDHALACVGDKVTIIPSTGIKNQTDSRVVGSITNAKVEVTGFTIEYTLTSKARLVIWNQGEPKWQTIFSEDPTCTRIVKLVDPNDASTNVTVYHKNDIGDPSSTTVWTNQGVFYIPIELAGYVQSAKVTLTYRIGSYNGSNWIYDSENEGSATLTLKDYAEAYQPGKHLYINITLNQMDIALTAAIAAWKTVEVVDVEGIED